MMNMKRAIQNFWNNNTHRSVESTTSETCHHQNLDDTLVWFNKEHATLRSYSQVDQQFYNQTTNDTSEIKPENWANKNKIRTIISFIYLFIINIYSEHETETGERNIVLTLR